MNIITFLPEEMILECCKKMDFRTRINFKKTCKFMNGFLMNPKEMVSEEEIKRWQQKVKLMLGFGILSNITVYKQLDLSNGYEEKIYMDYDDKKEMVLFSTTYRTTHILNNLIKAYSAYDMEQDGVSVNGQGGMLFSKFKLKNEQKQPDEKGLLLTANFLYDLYLSSICEWQHKNKPKVMKQQIADVFKKCLDQSNVSYDIDRFFAYSKFLNIPYTMNLITDNDRKKIEDIKEELMKEMKKYFMDGEEAFYFMNTCNLLL